MSLETELPAAESPTQGRHRILIVDDERDFLAMLALTLQQTGKYEVRGESDARRTVPVARQFRPDMVLLDVMMPEADGGDVAALLKADPATAHIPIVFLTALVGPAEAAGHAPLQSGGQRYLPKPVAIEELERCIEQILARPEPERGE